MSELNLELIGDPKLSDVHALMDSYALKFEIDGRIYYHAPIVLLHLDSLCAPASTERPETLTLNVPPCKTPDVTLTRWEPHQEPGDPEPKTRWPFWVEAPMLFVVTFKTRVTSCLPSTRLHA